MKRDKNRFTGDSDLWVFIPKDEVKLAGFDPSQNRGEDGKWGSEGCHNKPLKFDKLMDQKDQTEKLIEYTTYGSENQYKRTVWVDWFLGENEESKSRIANEIDNDSELERAMKSALYDFWKTESLPNAKWTYLPKIMETSWRDFIII